MTQEPNLTCYTILNRALNVSDEDAWAQLVEHYRRFIFYVLTQLNVSASDIDDVSQLVLVALTKDLANFDRDKGRFRSWLSAVIRNTAISYFRSKTRYQNRISDLQNEVPDGTFGQPAEIDAMIEREWKTYIATQAFERVEAVFEKNALSVFELSLEGFSATEIAEKTGLAVASVYTLKKRVKKRLCSEMMALTAELEL